MPSIVYPSLNVIGTPIPVNLDDVNSITKSTYTDLNDKALNRYNVIFSIGSSQVVWSYYNYESRDVDYNTVIDIGAAEAPIIPAVQRNSDFIVQNRSGLHLVDCSIGDIIITLDPSSYDSGRQWKFKKVTELGRMVFTPIGATIDDDSTAISTRYNTSVTVSFDGTNFKLT